MRRTRSSALLSVAAGAAFAATALAAPALAAGSGTAAAARAVCPAPAPSPRPTTGADGPAAAGRTLNDDDPATGDDTPPADTPPADTPPTTDAPPADAPPAGGPGAGRPGGRPCAPAAVAHRFRVEGVVGTVDAAAGTLTVVRPAAGRRAPARDAGRTPAVTRATTAGGPRTGTRVTPARAATPRGDTLSVGPGAAVRLDGRPVTLAALPAGARVRADGVVTAAGRTVVRVVAVSPRTRR